MNRLTLNKEAISVSNNDSCINNQHTSDSNKYLGYEVYLNEVKPTKCFLIVSCRCEIKNSIIRNKSVTAIAENDTAMVACRYLQARQGQRTTRNEAIGWSIFGNICSHGCVNIRNTLRYKKTKRGCKTYLINNLGHDKLQEIQRLPYTKSGLRELKTLLPESCDMINLDGKIDRMLSCC